jgi:hypothetical protein
MLFVHKLDLTLILPTVTIRSRSVEVSHELGLSCDYDIISSGLFYYLPYDES